MQPPAFIFGPWQRLDPSEIVRMPEAIRAAPVEEHRAEVWWWQGIESEPAPEADIGWYGCFGAAQDSHRLTDRGGTIEEAMDALDRQIRAAGHRFAEELDADETGFERAPDRYMAGGRETIDQVRDLAQWLAGPKGDRLFAAFCFFTAFIYCARAGRKGPARKDLDKARWFLQMVGHVLLQTADPRASRPTYQLYVQKPLKTFPPALYDVVRMMLGYSEQDERASSWPSQCVSGWLARVFQALAGEQREGPW